MYINNKKILSFWFLREKEGNHMIISLGKDNIKKFECVNLFNKCAKQDPNHELRYQVRILYYDDDDDHPLPLGEED